MSDRTYGSIKATFLDRSTNKEKPSMLYPVTEIVLQELTSEGVIDKRTFVVKEGKWVEIN